MLVCIGNSGGTAGPTAGSLGPSSGLVSPSSGTAGAGSGEAGFSGGPALPPGTGAGAAFQGTTGSGPQLPGSTDDRAGPPAASGIVTTALPSAALSLMAMTPAFRICMSMMMMITFSLHNTTLTDSSRLYCWSECCSHWGGYY